MERVGYRKNDISPSGMFETLASILKVLMKNFRPGQIEMKSSMLKAGYLMEVQKNCPSDNNSDLTAYPISVGAQAVSLCGKPTDDFLFVCTALRRRD